MREEKREKRKESGKKKEKEKQEGNGQMQKRTEQNRAEEADIMKRIKVSIKFDQK